SDRVAIPGRTRSRLAADRGIGAVVDGAGVTVIADSRRIRTCAATRQTDVVRAEVIVLALGVGRAAEGKSTLPDAGAAAEGRDALREADPRARAAERAVARVGWLVAVIVLDDALVVRHVAFSVLAEIGGVAGRIAVTAAEPARIGGAAHAVGARGAVRLLRILDVGQVAPPLDPVRLGRGAVAGGRRTGWTAGLGDCVARLRVRRREARCRRRVGRARAPTAAVRERPLGDGGVARVEALDARGGELRNRLVHGVLALPLGLARLAVATLDAVGLHREVVERRLDVGDDGRTLGALLALRACVRAFLVDGGAGLRVGSGDARRRPAAVRGDAVIVAALLRSRRRGAPLSAARLRHGELGGRFRERGRACTLVDRHVADLRERG